MNEEPSSKKEHDPILVLALLHLAVKHNCFTWVENGVPDFVKREEFLRRWEAREGKTESAPKKKAA